MRGARFEERGSRSEVGGTRNEERTPRERRVRGRAESLRASCEGVDERLLREHLVRLDERYFERFSEEEICSHVKAISGLSPEQPVAVLVDRNEKGTVECTVLSYDYPGEFSLITGVLTAMGLHILSGDVFTYAEIPSHRAGKDALKGFGGGPEEDPLYNRRRIVDHFSGSLDTLLSPDAWSRQLAKTLEGIIRLLEEGGEGSAKEARHRVNEMFVRRLAFLHPDMPATLYPVEIEVPPENGPQTRLKVISQDTPGFLYALSNALSLQGVSIEQVKIRTIGSRVEDQIDLADCRGRKIQDPDQLRKIRMSVLLTKQFTYFLGKAPDPYKALLRFEHLTGEILSKGETGWLSILTDPYALRDLARVLGASDYLWEDFIRLQYETLLPIFQTPAGRLGLTPSPESVPRRLKEAMAGADSEEEERRRLNEFKDREIFLIDLVHMLDPKADFQGFAERLTRLAEAVVSTATDCVYGRLCRQFGRPRTVAGIEARYAVLGLGKLGGVALGYASDIELLYVYSDSGKTDGERVIENAEFFDRLVKGVVRFVRAKREGIFHVDLRLRPYGDAGPLATSLETFCDYYGPGGRAHSYERLSLVRLRAVGGDRDLGSQLERLRDEMVYFSGEMDFREISELRDRQCREKTAGRGVNAKFSPGGLVDVEYSIQALQVKYGKAVPGLRTPMLHHALYALLEEGLLFQEEGEGLMRAYDFLRRLINGMRMLRGSAGDLFLPSPGSDEFEHLSRRMGYRVGEALGPGEQLRMDFETHTAMVRAFVEGHFGRTWIPGRKGAGTISDLILSREEFPFDEIRRILNHVGFRDTEKAYVNLKAMAGEGSRRETFARLVLLACDILAGGPDPDMALNNWERFSRSLGSPEFHFRKLLSQPMQLELLLGVLARSQFLSDVLVRTPGFFDWVMIPELLHNRRRRGEVEEELRMLSQGCGSHGEWLNRLRRVRRREVLRVGTRDMCLGTSVEETVEDLSVVAEALVEVTLERGWSRWREEGRVPAEVPRPEQAFSVLAFGKLGGRELNYSSDIDLVGVWDPPGGLRMQDPHYDVLRNLYAHAVEQLRADLSNHTEEGHAYRVDLRLRPFGRSGELVTTLRGLLDYYRTRADLWEIQAALKLRPVAGDQELGDRVMEGLRPFFTLPRSREAIVASIERMRHKARKRSARQRESALDVKAGPGGLRDIEFLVQGLQLIHGPECPHLLEGNTLLAIRLLERAGKLPEKIASDLTEDYCFLRKVEHFLQIMEDRQTHDVPWNQVQMNALAGRVRGKNGTGEEFAEALLMCLERVQKAYGAYLLEEKSIEKRREEWNIPPMTQGTRRTVVKSTPRALPLSNIKP